MSEATIIVISDLHIGAGPLDDCDGELEQRLCAFLNEISSKDSAVELVINGDFLDFAQAPPWRGPELESVSKSGVALCFTEEQSLTKLEEIYHAHELIFRSLGEFISAKMENRLIILPGNHDADFFWPEVRSSFTDKTCGQNIQAKNRIRFCLDQVYRPLYFPKAWIEHGHQHDPCNSFYVDGKPCWSVLTPPIFEDQEGKQRLYECIGTRFLIKFLNHLDAKYPFVDNVKPFSRFLRIFGASALVWGYGPINAAVAVWAMLRFLVTTVTHNPNDLLGLDENKGQKSALLLKFAEEMSPKERKDFANRLRERGLKIDRPLTMYLENVDNANLLMAFLSENFDILENLQDDNGSYLSSTSDEKGTLTLAKGFSVDETRELKRVAKKALQENDLEIIIMGHTHDPVNDPLEERYINTGCWTRYYRFGETEKLRPWSMLRSRSYEIFPYQLNYAEIVPERPQPTRLVTSCERKHDRAI